MKNAKTILIKNSFLLFLIIFSSCKSNLKNEKKISVDKKPYPIIQTNSLKDDFDGELINTLHVKEKDTVLFRKWYSDADSLNIGNYKLWVSPYVKYYKTGENKPLWTASP